MANWRKSFKPIEVGAHEKARPTPVPKPRASISACLIVKNEARCLARCLNSLQGLVDEIVVVDTGSTDETVEIAERFGAKIGRFEWCDDFAAARNAALDLATGEWILSVDADEWLESDETRRTIVECVNDRPKDSWAFRMINIDGKESWTNPKLFPRAGARWVGRLHEQAEVDGLPGSPAADPKLRIGHDGYAPEQLGSKGDRNLRVIARARESEAMTPELQVAEAIERAKIGEPDSPEILYAVRDICPDWMLSRLLMRLAISLKVVGRNAEIAPIAEDAIKRRVGEVWAPFMLAIEVAEGGRYADALRYLLVADASGELNSSFRSNNPAMYQRERSALLRLLRKAKLAGHPDLVGVNLPNG